ncbi:MAG TPA: MFS transporter [Solirubrobacteraceae bacterium]|nr:MFS transporter [Solirubrobacteraceae bacterium]
MSATATRQPPGGREAELGAGVSNRLVLLLAVGTGAAAANLYYAQPLLHTLGRAFSVSTGTSGLIVTLSQIGYVLGLAFVLPLGDLLERRRLITATMVLTAAAMVACGLAPSFVVFAAATLVVGVSAVTAQVIVPMSSSLARPHERGRVVGTVMSGLLLGILLARTFSGIVAGALGWRVPFLAAAALMLGLAAVLRRALPRVPPTASLRYGEVLRSVLGLIRAEPVLRERMALGALAFGCFSVLWTSLSFLLSAAPFHDGNTVIGLFGLAGVAGAGAATVVGRAADHGRGAAATTLTALLMFASFGLLWIFRHSTIGLIVAIVVLDLGVQGIHISNQHAIYELSDEARSRLTTAYMVAYFAGGALLSAITAALYSSTGWAGVCAIGGATGLAAVLVWGATRVGGRRSAR